MKGIVKMSIKISSLEVENVKRVKAVSLTPTAEGLTVLGGRNGQGKTSVLDSIAWCLGGNKFMPSSPKRDGSTIPPHLKIKLSNGIVVERSGKNSNLKVIDPEGNKSGQTLLNEFISSFALDLPKFMSASGKEKADILLQIIGVGDELYMLENEETTTYNQRHAIGQIADQKKKYALEMEEYEGVPSELISPYDLIKQQQAILVQNGENQKKREHLSSLESQNESLTVQIATLERNLAELKDKRRNILSDIEIAKTSVQGLEDKSTTELEESIANIDSINRKVRANLDKAKAEEDAKNYQDQYNNLTHQIEEIRKRKYDLLNNANLPLPGLSVEGKELTYKGYKWDNMSSAEQLKVATAIIRKLNPNCGFVLLDKLEQMDVETLAEFNQWLESENLQAIATRVSTGDECSIIIEDGYVKNTEQKPFVKKEFKKGEF